MALTEEQLVIHVYVQVIPFVKSFLIYVRWDQVWGTGGPCPDESLNTSAFNRLWPI
jgi:hypothetical protein